MSDEPEEILLIGNRIDLIGHLEAECPGVSLLLTALPRQSCVKRLKVQVSASDAASLGAKLVKIGQELRGNPL